MNGLEKIIGHIKEEALGQSNALLSAAEAKKNALEEDVNNRLREETGHILKKAETEAAGILERSRASADLKKKQIFLRGKQELIQETLKMARESLNSLSEKDYFDLLGKLFEKYLPESDAVLQFSAKDLERIPESMKQDFVRKAAEKGAKLTISDIPAEIADGFLLDFGGVEENCSFEALINENREKLEDRIHQILFS